MSIADFMAAAVAQEPNKAYDAFDSAIAERIGAKIDDLRSEVIARTFNGSKEND
jgi:hypothetical protein